MKVKIKLKLILPKESEYISLKQKAIAAYMSPLQGAECLVAYWLKGYW